MIILLIIITQEINIIFKNYNLKIFLNYNPYNIKLY